eukprot:3938263-Pyramimonas_sp.AAC.1
MWPRAAVHIALTRGFFMHAAMLGTPFASALSFRAFLQRKWRASAPISDGALCKITVSQYSLMGP